MPTYFEWARPRLAGTRDTAHVFWLDVESLLSRRHGGPFDDREDQSITDDRGREWTVVRYIANAMPARRKLADGGRVVVWCVGGPDRDYTDLTPLEDFLSTAYDVLEIGLDAVASERNPDLDLPTHLSRRTRGIVFDTSTFVDRLARQASAEPLSIVTALNLLVEIATGAEGGVRTTDAGTLVQSTASTLAAASDENGIRAINAVLADIAENDLALGELAGALLRLEPRDVLVTTYLASGLARLGVANIGALLAAEGLCPGDLRSAFEHSGGRWSRFATMEVGELQAIGRRCDHWLDAGALPQITALLASAPFAVETAAAEPIPIVRLAAILAHMDDFVAGITPAAASPGATEAWGDDLRAIDRMAPGLRIAAGAPYDSPSEECTLVPLVQAWSFGPVAKAELIVSRATTALRQLRRLLRDVTFSRLEAQLAAANELVRLSQYEWDAAFTALVSSDVAGYLDQPLQTWRRLKDVSARSSQRQTWLLILDGLRYDLWSSILAPALAHRGWRVAESDMGLAYLPSITETARRVLVGASPQVSGAEESKLVEGLAGTMGVTHTYALRAESFRGATEEHAKWNVRVFSWPDRFVHAEIADFGTLANQFEHWVEGEFVPWLDATIPKSSSMVISADHGFVELRPEDAIEVGTIESDDRNRPRIAPGAVSSTYGIRVDRPGGSSTVATSRRWFRATGGRFWRFAHGGATLPEVVVPFAVLSFAATDSASITISGLPAELLLKEGDNATLSFTVRVTGGAALFPTVTIGTNSGALKTQQISLGAAVPIEAALVADESLTTLIVTVTTAGSDRQQVLVPVTVELAKIRRSAIDFDV